MENSCFFRLPGLETIFWYPLYIDDFQTLYFFTTVVLNYKFMKFGHKSDYQEVSYWCAKPIKKNDTLVHKWILFQNDTFVYLPGKIVIMGKLVILP